MLELKQITKVYPAGGENVQALKGVDMQFRKSEFVSVLGQSGCGKTTLLNIIGGLDQYTSGDLQINGRSTKDFKDRDWDAYRNHSIGFVFQSYNLIPHQTVLQNVELALTLSGVKKSERRKRAKEALIRVGLADQMKKKPAEMSGGQMQRVAIARAIVNNPDIILADEPTGALDTETSKQVMDILKEIAKDRLVIMVTHNPDLANEYSTRIIRMLDGRVIDDSAPLTEEELAAEAAAQQENTAPKGKKKMPAMSFGTSFGLSLKNLFTKKGRTALTSFAGSIGIIGIALIYAVSQGTTTYIDTVQEDTLSSYPLTLEAQHADLGTLIETFMGKAQSTHDHEKDAVYQKAMLYDLVNAINTMEMQENDLAAFKKHLEKERAKEDSDLQKSVAGVQYTYGMDMLVYTKSVDGEIIQSDAEALMQDILLKYMNVDLSFMMQMRDQTVMGGLSNMSSSGSELWQEMLPGDDGKVISPVLEKQYDLVYGNWPTKYNEIVLVLDSQNELNDLALYALGLKSREEIEALMLAAKDQTTVDYEAEKWSYKDICETPFRTILGANCYTDSDKDGIYTDLRETEAGLKYLYDNGIDLHVTGIIRPNEDAVSTMLTGSIGYTSLLTEYVIEHTKDAEALKAQLENKNVDVFTGLPFEDKDGAVDKAKKAKAFTAYIDEQDEKGKADAYVKIKSLPSPELVKKTVDDTLSQMNRETMEETLTAVLTEQMGMEQAEVESYVAAMSDDDMRDTFAQMIEQQFREQYAAGVQEQMAGMSSQQLAGALAMEMQGYTDEQRADYYDEVLEFSLSTYDANLRILNYVDIDSPETINLYASSFADKDVIEDAIADYNDSVDDVQEIRYTDYVGLMMSSVTTIIDAITYVLIAFVSVSLIVSSIMIGVITLISVQERTKEIGILRAIGASKRNVSSMFNAETMIIGFTSGLLGVLITYLLCIPINLILHSLTGINNLSAILPIPVAVILVVISMLLTLIAGIIPSRSAAKKDPVVALRTE